MNLAAAAEQLAEAINADIEARGGDLVVSPDPEALQLPGGYLVLDGLDMMRLDGSTVEARWRLYLIAGDHAIPAVLDELGKMFDLVKHYGSGAAELVTLALPNYASNGLPSLSIIIPTEITEE